MNKSNKGSWLTLKYFGGKESWKAYIAEGGAIGSATEIINKFVVLLDIFEDMNMGKQKTFIMNKYHLKLSAYNSRVKLYKRFGRLLIL